jgi:WD40 repeat protein
MEAPTHPHSFPAKPLSTNNAASSFTKPKPTMTIVQTPAATQAAASKITPTPNHHKTNVAHTSDLISNKSTTHHQQLQKQFPVNEECTSLTVTPSGHFVLAGFTDGTLRLFDATGRYHHSQQQQQQYNSKESIMSDVKGVNNTYNNKTASAIVCSNAHQTYGAVASQIHARGVHTSLLMTVDCSRDGAYAFAGVTRGSMELTAVHLEPLETNYEKTENNTSKNNNMLDHLTVYRYANAKLRGFGACARVDAHPNKYLLLCGKGIKNIHVWSFEPPTICSDEPTWTILYNCVTNGNSITQLYFRHNGNDNTLYALSKSQQQKLRVWDLSSELVADEKRPSRPPFEDVVNTESCLGVAGSFVLCGGDELYNQMAIVSLDADTRDLYNLTELALPGVTPLDGGRRRQQRGDLKNIEAVAGMTLDGGQALLELNDKTLVQYTHQAALPKLTLVENSTLPEGWTRTLCVSRIAPTGTAVAGVAVYNPAAGKGSISMWSLDDDQPNGIQLWGNACQVTHPKPELSPLLANMDSPNRSDDDSEASDQYVENLSGSIHLVTTAKKPTVARVQSTDSSVRRIQTIPKMKDLEPVSLETKVRKLSPEQNVAGLSDPSASFLLEPTVAKGRSHESVSKRSTKRATPAPDLMSDSEDMRLVKVHTPMLSKSKPSLSAVRAVKYARAQDGARMPTELILAKERNSMGNAESTCATPKLDSRKKPLVEQSLSLIAPIKPQDPPDQVLRRRSPLSTGENNTDEAMAAASAMCSMLNGLAVAPIPKIRNMDGKGLKSPMQSPKRSRSNENGNNAAMQLLIRQKCIEQQVIVQKKLNEFVRDRIDFRSEVIQTNDEKLDKERRKLAAEHLAAQERAAKMILRAAFDVLESVKRSPSLASLDQARDFLRDTINSLRTTVVCFATWVTLRTQTVVLV